MKPPTPADAVGQCAACLHVRQVASARGSVFTLCRRAAGDARFQRYPRLPVAFCPGFEAAARICDDR